MPETQICVVPDGVAFFPPAGSAVCGPTGHAAGGINGIPPDPAGQAGASAELHADLPADHPYQRGQQGCR